MTSARFVVAMLLVGSLPALAQTQKESASAPSGSVSESAPVDGWHIPQRLPDENPGQFAMGQNARFPVGALKANVEQNLASGDKDSSPDYACFTMRSYVVARDNKDSDSVHLVRYSTCEPSSRYQLKTTQLESDVPRLVIQP